jgi:hypothetical protein
MVTCSAQERETSPSAECRQSCEVKVITTHTLRPNTQAARSIVLYQAKIAQKKGKKYTSTLQLNQQLPNFSLNALPNTLLCQAPDRDLSVLLLKHYVFA